jgi:hypothetical protein
MVVRCGSTRPTTRHVAVVGAERVPVAVVGDDPLRVAMTAVVEDATTTGVEVADADATDAKSIVILEERSLFTLKCGGCGHRWEVRGCRVDDLSGFDIGDEEDCPGCHGVFPVVRE